MARKCWAQGLSPCSGSLTDEHYLSRCLLEGKTVEVRGLRFCRHEIAQIGVASLVSKCLCEGHNNGFSGLDEAGKAAHETVLAVIQLMTSPRQRVTREFTIDATAFARWIAKTACSVMAAEGAEVHEAFACMALGIEHPNSPLLHIAADTGFTFDLESNHIGLAWLFEDSTPRRMAVTMIFRGLRFCLSNIALDKLPEDVLEGIGISRRAMQGPRCVVFKRNAFPVARVQFVETAERSR